ncbi:DUF4422 domain-containing protein [Hydrogenoanaerobacterium sp.]|uniref:DUF4422 domain-containing protein n=1 Tax=Hydrogenoanaerobacterium sp. TaxID=2953763 RepID=UPI0028972561|nr:DUF4422 domain-containing protein [Hydrogenoanaerobacterium sp.]
MSNIKIFVSHRIDIDSEVVDNPIYIPLRCGAVYDERKNITMQGDDTGDNISEKRMSFCEYTVQYWAWKNTQADYYGLCHYRRYLSFAQHQFKTDEFNMVHGTALMPRSKMRYGLLNAATMEQVISDYDIVVSEYADVRKISTPCGKKETVYEMWNAYVGIFFEKSAFDLVFKLIDEMAPRYSKSAREYFSGNLHRGFNCYVLKKELFERLCEFQFPIMFEVERRLDTTGYTQTMLRTPAFIGEMLYGIFIYHVTTYEKWGKKELQLVFFNNTERIKGPMDMVKRYILSGVNRGLRAMIDPIMPVGSRRREVLKNIYYFVTPTKRMGVAEIQNNCEDYKSCQK